MFSDLMNEHAKSLVCIVYKGQRMSWCKSDLGRLLGRLLTHFYSETEENSLTEENNNQTIKLTNTSDVGNKEH